VCEGVSGQLTDRDNQITHTVRGQAGPARPAGSELADASQVIAIARGLRGSGRREYSQVT
jgi:hypothetical protein